MGTRSNSCSRSHITGFRYILRTRSKLCSRTECISRASGTLWELVLIQVSRTEYRHFWELVLKAFWDTYPCSPQVNPNPVPMQILQLFCCCCYRRKRRLLCFAIFSVVTDLLFLLIIVVSLFWILLLLLFTCRERPVENFF